MALANNPLSGQKLRCCANKPIKKITYSCGPNGTETILVCKECHKLDEFGNKDSIILEENL
jgi:Fe2+ or Zn2+ uptake regulation protein